MEIKTLSITPNPINIIANAARITRGKEEIYKSDEYNFDLLYKSGHHSTFEHVTLSFLINGISRACSHQLVRFRIGVSFTQRSQRYTDETEFNFVIPPSIQKNDVALNKFISSVNQCRANYEELVSMSILKEDARFILPNAVSTDIIMTMNYRELMHACGLRLCKKAQWEIRMLFWLIKMQVTKLNPILSKYLQPKCFHDGFCREVNPCKMLNYYLNLRSKII